MQDSDLTDLERRLSGWQPSRSGLDADAMLFAAGRASVRPGAARWAWPAVAACLAFTAAWLGAEVHRERIENQALLARLEPSAAPAPAHDQPLSLPPSSMLLMRRDLELNPDGLFRTPVILTDLVPSVPVPRVGNRNLEINQ